MCVSICKSALKILQIDKNKIVTWNSLKRLNTRKLDPKIILSDENRNTCIKKLKLSSKVKNSDDKVKEAAVLVPICLYKRELGLLYTLRSLQLNSNRGQVSFPGGIRDEGDKSYEDTALRETFEELKIPREQVDVWTRCFSLTGQRGIRVMPVLGYIGEVEPEMLDVNKEEVDEAFVVTLRDLCDESNCRFTQFRNNFVLPTFIGGKHRIWGLTAMITHIVMKALITDGYNHKLTFLKAI